MYDIFNVLLEAVCHNFVEDFSMYVHRAIIGLKLSFFVKSLSDLGIRMMLAS